MNWGIFTCIEVMIAIRASIVVCAFSILFLTRVNAQETGCYRNKDQHIALKIDDRKNFSLVQCITLMGTSYLNFDRGSVELKNDGLLIFFIKEEASFLIPEKKLASKSDFPDPFIEAFGTLTKNGVKMRWKGDFMKRCSCKRKEFRSMKALLDF